MAFSSVSKAVVRPYRNLPLCWALIAGAGLTGCGSEGDASKMAADQAATTTEAELALLACNFDTFEVDITDGPTMGLHVEGALMLMLEPPSSKIVGSLATKDGVIPVSGAVYAPGEISLTFHTADGYIMGLGKIGADFCAQGAEFKGVAIGPDVSDTDELSESDTGHWLLAQPHLITKLGTISLAGDPLDGASVDSEAGCTTSGNTQTCNSHVFPDASSATGCSQSTSTCTFDGTKNTCSSTKIAAFCPDK